MKGAPVFMLMGIMLLSLGCSQQAELPNPLVDDAFDTLKGAFAGTDSGEEKARL